MALEGEVLGALHHGVEDPSSIWRTTVGEVVAMRDELVLLVQVRIIGLAILPSLSFCLMRGRRVVCADTGQRRGGTISIQGRFLPPCVLRRAKQVGL